MYHRLKKVNEQNKINLNKNATLNKKESTIRLKKISKGKFELERNGQSHYIYSFSTLSNLLIKNNYFYVTNLSCIASDTKFFCNVYVTEEDFICIKACINDFKLKSLKFKLVDNLEKYISTLMLTKKAYIILDSIYYVLLRYDSYCELISEKPLIINPSYDTNCLNLNYLETLETLYIDNLDWHLCTTIDGFFKYNVNLKSLFLRNFNIDNVISVKELFSECTNLKYIDICPNTKVSLYTNMFKG